MPHRSSGGRSACSPPRALRRAPKPVNHAPARAQSGNSGSLFGTIAEGMAFGARTAVADRAVDYVLLVSFGKHTKSYK